MMTEHVITFQGNRRKYDAEITRWDCDVDNALSISAGESLLQPENSVKNMGAYFNNCLNISEHLKLLASEVTDKQQTLPRC